MMEKVKLTQYKIDKLKRIKKELPNEVVIRRFSNRRYYGCLVSPKTHITWESLVDLTLDEMIRALYIGYEVEPEFKIGDWVVVDGYSEDYDGKVLNITKIYKGALNLRYCKFSPSNDNSHNFCLDSLTKVRHATPEEIAQEKERRWWASHGRDVWELKYNDIIYDCIEEDYINAGYLSVGEHEQERFDVVCFADDRKDVKE